MSETVTFQLNDKTLTVPKGWTVMQAVKSTDVKIPYFCWHPGLSVAGVCRFCMVHVEGSRKLEVACNLPIRAGMVVRTDTPEVKEAHKWALEFHLVNHPLDCPICDQAGECGLQDFYMEVGKYDSQMTRPKVLKPKALDVGSELVLDTERCILCSRCVRFEEEVTKTNALGIFSRGDRSIIGTYGDEKLTHQYQENLVDVCPVGAFTSKKFRFKQRVWFLQEKNTICGGCSTGCHVQVHARPQIRRYFRIKPRESKVNSYWMCDVGRQTFNHLNPENRLAEAQLKNTPQTNKEALGALAQKLKSTAKEQTALLVSAQYTNEEYAELFRFFVGKLGIKNIYLWREPTEQLNAFDGILLRGDRNANTLGLRNALKKHNIEKVTIADESSKCFEAKPSCLIALSPEIPQTFPSLESHWAALGKLPFVSLWSLHYEAGRKAPVAQILPMKGFAEKTGTFTNSKNELGNLEEAFPAAVSAAMDLCDVVRGLEEHF